MQPLFVSVDPARDTPDVVRTYLEANYPRFLGLTGDAERVDAMKTAYKVFTRRIDGAQDAAGYAVSHTAFSYLIGADGRYLAHFTEVADAQHIAKTLRSTLDGGRS